MGRTIGTFLCALLLGASLAHADGAVPLARDLRAEAAQAQARGTSLMVMFYAEDCIFCARMEEEFLNPMASGGFYDTKVTMRRVRLDAGFMVTDFDGRRVSGADLAQRYGVHVTPTLLFLDAHGVQLADRMVGLSTPDYFGGYLDAAIDSAQARLRTGATAAVAHQVDDTCNPLC